MKNGSWLDKSLDKSLREHKPAIASISSVPVCSLIQNHFLIGISFTAAHTRVGSNCISSTYSTVSSCSMSNSIMYWIRTTSPEESHNTDFGEAAREKMPNRAVEVTVALFEVLEHKSEIIYSNFSKVSL